MALSKRKKTCSQQWEISLLGHLFWKWVYVVKIFHWYTKKYVQVHKIKDSMRGGKRVLDNLEHFCEGGKRMLENLKGSWRGGKRVLDNSEGSRKRGKRVLEIFKGPKTLLGSKTLFPLTHLLLFDTNLEQ